MPQHQVRTVDAIAEYRRTGMIPRYCVSCGHAQWNHRGVYPAKRQCSVQACSCSSYLELQRQQLPLNEDPGIG